MADNLPPQNLPMGRIEAFEVGTRKMTVQTEFFPSPVWHVETKIYLGGELKKVYTDDLSGVEEAALQRRVDQFHQVTFDGIVAGLRNRIP